MAATHDREASELRARLLARGLGDFDLFCRGLVLISTKERTQQHLKWNFVQSQYCAARTRRDVVLKPRQVGLSTLELARDVWKFLQPGQRVFVVCQTDAKGSYLRKFSEDVNRIFAGLARAGLRLDFGINAIGTWSLPRRDSYLQIVEAGASEAAAVKKGRGGTYSRLHSTEAAFYEHPEKALNAALEGVPDLPGTEIVFESTANGAGTWFHNFWSATCAGTSGYTPHFFPFYANPEYQTPISDGETISPCTEREEVLVEMYGVTPEQLKWWRAKVASKGTSLVEQEYPTDPLTCFLVSGRMFFDSAATERLIAKVREPVATERRGAVRVWERPRPECRYVISADPSEGTGGDPGAGIVRERTTGRLCAVLHGQFPTWDFGALLSDVGHEYNRALVVVERNNHGHAVLQSLERGDSVTGRKPYPRIFRDADESFGWLNTEVSRSTALEAFEKSHRDGTWSTPDARTLDEFRTFVVNVRKRNRAEAQSGRHDDLVLAEAICNDVLSRPERPHGPPGTKARIVTTNHDAAGIY